MQIPLTPSPAQGSLDFYVHQVRKDDPLSVREVVYFALDMACGLSYLHPRCAVAREAGGQPCRHVRGSSRLVADGSDIG